MNGMPLEIAVGRWLACVVRPLAAWRVLPPRDRALLVGTYAAAGYTGTLILLLLGGL